MSLQSYVGTVWEPIPGLKYASTRRARRVVRVSKEGLLVLNRVDAPGRDGEYCFLDIFQKHYRMVAAS